MSTKTFEDEISKQAKLTFIKAILNCLRETSTLNIRSEISKAVVHIDNAVILQSNKVIEHRRLIRNKLENS